MVTLYIYGSVLLVSLSSAIAIVTLAVNKSVLKAILAYLVSFATGAIFANVFLHLLPELVETSPDIHWSFAIMLLGLLGSFIIEKFIHWHHCHNLDCHTHEPVGTMILVGDGLHNVLDGMLIAGAYLVSIELGIATTIAIILHEIPQEIGDFAVLVHSGWSRSKALAVNVLSALTAFIGAMIVIVISQYTAQVTAILLPITAGNLLYIAGSDLIPALHKVVNVKKSLLQLCALLLGITVLAALIPKHSHEHEHEHVEQPEEYSVPSILEPNEPSDHLQEGNTESTLLEVHHDH